MTPARRTLLAAPALLLASRVRAQADWPERPVRFIVPFPPGSTPDVTGRAVAGHLARALGQPSALGLEPGAA